MNHRRLPTVCVGLGLADQWGALFLSSTKQSRSPQKPLEASAQISTACCIQSPGGRFYRLSRFMFYVLCAMRYYCASANRPRQSEASSQFAAVYKPRRTGSRLRAPPSAPVLEPHFFRGREVRFERSPFVVRCEIAQQCHCLLTQNRINSGITWAIASAPRNP